MLRRAVHGRLGNQLSKQRAKDRVYVFTNLRLFRKLEAVDYKESVVDWASDSDSGSSSDEE